ncbi:MAG: hypothetical protein ACRCX5_14385 [Bacteroidales bacterium]
MAKKQKQKDYAEYVIAYCPFTGNKEVVRHQLNPENNGSKNIR